MSATRPTSEEVREYVLNHYGECKKASGCVCIRGTWLGLSCPYWRPAYLAAIMIGDEADNTADENKSE